MHKDFYQTAPARPESSCQMQDALARANVATRMSQFNAATDTLRRNLEELNAMVDALDVRLTPLMRSLGPIKEEGAHPEECYVPAADEIRNSSKRAAVMAQRLQSMLDRLEI